MEATCEIKAGAISFHACQFGENPQCVFLHGFGGDLHTWDRLCKQLKDHYSYLRYDLRGFGKTRDVVAEPFSHSEDLLAILDQQGIERCDLIGLSMGGAVALQFSLNHPERVRSLTLLSPGMVAWEFSAEWQAMWRQITDRARAGDMNEARKLWWQHPLFATTRESDAAEELLDSIQAYSGEQWVKDRQMNSMPDVERLHQLACPLLLLTGEQDMEEFRLIADVLAASVESVQRKNLAGGHLLNLEVPELCAQELESFLQPLT